VCGDNVCDSSAGEDEFTCCTDCGCENGYTCDTNVCVYVGTSVLKWTVVDGCNDGQDIQIRFWDFINQLVWPDNVNVYVQSYFTQVTYSLQCTTGNTICLGANEPVNQLYWGVDIDGSETCPDCCYTCANASVTGINGGTLTCP
jgi:hypothetical protein